MARIIFKGKTKKGSNIVIRYPEMKDARSMLEFDNKLSSEQTFVLTQGEQKTLAEAEELLKTSLAKIKANDLVLLMAFSEGRCAGRAAIRIKNNTVSAHVGTLVIAVGSDFRGGGIGELLMKTVIDEAREKLRELKIIDLDVFGSNIPARRLYKKFGFIECGIMPRGYRRKGKYDDCVWMYKKIK